jgi:hypothetical protein
MSYYEATRRFLTWVKVTQGKPLERLAGTPWERIMAKS